MSFNSALFITIITMASARPQGQSTNLEYQPNRPFYAGSSNWNMVPPLIPPGDPLPNGPTNSTTAKPIGNRFGEDSKSTTSTEKDPAPMLEYQPNRPPFAGSSQFHEVGQIVPSGTPWPDSPAGYTTTGKPIVDRFQEVMTSVTNKPDQETVHATKQPWHEILELFFSVQPPPRMEAGQGVSQVPDVVDRFVVNSTPRRPTFAASQSNVNQIIPPGKPWPDSPEGYGNEKMQEQRVPEGAKKVWLIPGKVPGTFTILPVDQ